MAPLNVKKNITKIKNESLETQWRGVKRISK